MMIALRITNQKNVQLKTCYFQWLVCAKLPKNFSSKTLNFSQNKIK